MNMKEKVNEMLEKNPELQEKVIAEVKRLADAEEAAAPEEATARAIKTVLGVDVTEEGAKGIQELSPDEMDGAAGGAKNEKSFFDKAGDTVLDGLETAGNAFFSAASRALCVFGAHQWKYRSSEYSPEDKMVAWDRVCTICGKHDVGHL